MVSFQLSILIDIWGQRPQNSIYKYQYTAYICVNGVVDIINNAYKEPCRSKR